MTSRKDNGSPHTHGDTDVGATGDAANEQAMYRSHPCLCWLEALPPDSSVCTEPTLLAKLA